MPTIRKRINTKAEHTEKSIQNALAHCPYHRQRYDVMIPNCYTSFDNEADLFAIRGSGFCDEFEVKLSVSDFKNDFNKVVQAYTPSLNEVIAYRQAKLFGKIDKPWKMPKHEALQSGKLSNYFWYVVPQGLISESDVPEYCGLIYIQRYARCYVVRNPKRLHRNKLTEEEKFFYARKLYFRYWDIRKPNHRI